MGRQIVMPKRWRIRTHPPTPEYEKGWERIFGKKQEEKEVHCCECGNACQCKKDKTG